MAAFLDGRIGFLDIATLVESALGEVDGATARDLVSWSKPTRARAARQRREWWPGASS